MTEVDDYKLREIAVAIIEGSAGVGAAQHALAHQTPNWEDAMRSAKAVSDTLCLPALLSELERKTKALEAAHEALMPFAELVDDAKESASALQCDREDFFVTQIGGYRVGDLYLSDFINAAAALKGEHHER